MHANADDLIGEPPMGAASPPSCMPRGGQVRGRADRRNGLPGSPPSCMPRPWKEKPMHANADDLIGEPPMGAAKDRFEVAQIGGMGFRGHLHLACPDHGKKNRCTQTPFSLVSLRWVRRRTGSRSRRSEEWASGVTSILHAPTMERKTDARKCRSHW